MLLYHEEIAASLSRRINFETRDFSNRYSIVIGIPSFRVFPRKKYIYFALFDLYKISTTRQILCILRGGGVSYLSRLPPTHEREAIRTRQALAKDFQRILLADKSNATLLSIDACKWKVSSFVKKRVLEFLVYLYVCCKRC